VTVLTVIPPIARRTNLNNTDTFSHGEIEYELYCDVDGRPQPELNWFKVYLLMYRNLDPHLRTPNPGFNLRSPLYITNAGGEPQVKLGFWRPEMSAL
jgi:hypothetical protein